MKKLLSVSGVLTLFICSVAVLAAMKAQANLRDAKGASVGTAVFTEKAKGVEIDLNVSGLTPGQHGFHIHNVGLCEAPDFASAGPHFNPEGKQHGWDNPMGHHLGDLKNLNVGPDGKAHADVLIPGVTLGEGPSSLFHEGGTALVIHAKPDDGKTDPAGNAGPRVACGVIMR